MTMNRYRTHLLRCIELAETAVSAGDEPFGSVLVSHDDVVLFEDRNRIGRGDATRHPEFAIARWAAENMSPDDRRRAVVYTSGEHCAMCAAAHGLVGLGKIVYASSTGQFTRWMAELGRPPMDIAPLTIEQVLKDADVEGPFPEFADHIRELHARAVGAS
ncbi:nucleoside deaminase [Methylobacterium radiodurans]|uniref:tRNA-specific adenosine deaminase n=1 Tax=Methylobacterium radiodurans TaxID=2202828 RepID=A0A2U8VNS6_9HYPH|nr:nucleoside deaminase [Methylobacterium radiodurans]AWN35052.1 tRNA-specific adenosine deaminase [Methylobacterium radiodurans]